MELSEEIKSPLKSVDGIIGVVMMLAYYSGGTNLFPANINIDEYTELYNGKVAITDKQLFALLQECSVSLDRPVKMLTTGSLKVYLSLLRKGKRPISMSSRSNVNDELIACNSTYDKHGQITISPRVLADDIEMGLFKVPTVPDWIQLLAERKGYC